MPSQCVRTKSFDHTICGLLTKRADLLGAAVAARAQLTRLRADIAALDRTLTALGYAGDLSALKPRRKRETIFQPGQLTRTLITVLREAERPMTGRDVTMAVLRRLGRSVPDDAVLADRTRRASRVLRTLEREGVAASGLDNHGRRRWSLKVATES